jgi:ribosomal protein S4
LSALTFYRENNTAKLTIMTRKRQERKRYLSFLLQQMENLNVNKKWILKRRRRIETTGRQAGTKFSSLSRIERRIKKVFQRNSSLLPPFLLWRGLRKNLTFSPLSQKDGNDTSKTFKVSPFQVERWGGIKSKEINRLPVIADEMLPYLKGYDGVTAKLLTQENNFFGEKRNSFSISLASLSQLKGEITRLESLRKSSLFRSQLVEGRRVSLLYGKFSRRKMYRLYSVLKKGRKLRSSFAENFVSLLERRADILLYRVRFFPSILSARQWIRHGRISLNGEALPFPEYPLSPGDLLSIPIRYHRFFGNLATRNIFDVTPLEECPTVSKQSGVNLFKPSAKQGQGIPSHTQQGIVPYSMMAHRTPSFPTLSEGTWDYLSNIRGSPALHHRCEPGLTWNHVRGGSHPTAQRVGKGHKFLFKVNWKVNLYKSYKSFKIPPFSTYNFLFGAGEGNETVKQKINKWNEGAASLRTDRSACSSSSSSSSGAGKSWNEKGTAGKEKDENLFLKRFFLLSLVFSRECRHFQSKELSQSGIPLWDETIAGETTSIQYRGNGFWSCFFPSFSETKSVCTPPYIENVNPGLQDTGTAEMGVGGDRQISPSTPDKDEWRFFSCSKESFGCEKREKSLQEKTAQNRTGANQLFQRVAAKLEKERKGVFLTRPIKPVQVEVSYSSLRLIYLYPPQRVSFPTLIDLDILERSFRGKG